MPWTILFDASFAAEAKSFPRPVQIEIAALAAMLREIGPQLRRPQCDTLKGSRHANMKELRIHQPDGAWRVAFAFDPERQAILLVGGNKSGVNERLFYRDLIRRADQRFSAHLERLTAKKGSPP